jgi:tetratricopeptide (TPR) repeat protein
MIAEGIKLLVNVRKRELVLIALSLALGFGARAIGAKQVDPSKPPPPPAQDTTPIDPSKPPPPPPGAAAPAPSTDANPADGASTPATSGAPALPAFDPLHAHKSIEVGQYYLKTGDYAAAVDRFKEAIGYQANLALPWDLLGQAYEKEHEDDEAVAAYQKYLVLLPNGKESDRVRKHVVKLQADMAHDRGKQSNK